MLEILSASQNDLPFQGEKHLQSRCFRRIILDNESYFKILRREMVLPLFIIEFGRFEKKSHESS